jgi:MFS superfamily sulfate permease-like transporter
LGFGLDPRFGLYSAIVVTAIASILGSSSHLINGPTNAISLVVFSALAFLDPEARFDAYQATFLLGIMVGSLQILIAVFRLGDLTRYISESVVRLRAGSSQPARRPPAPRRTCLCRRSRAARLVDREGSPV